jgi:hypothetical protein
LKSWQQVDGDPLGRAQLTAQHRLQDLRPLDNRAAVCMKCHIGPQVIGEPPVEPKFDDDKFPDRVPPRRPREDVIFDVNHDLIAAGHPRLTFEFNAYLTNLPKHWDEAAIAKKQGQSVDPSFHFESWREGQVQKVKQVAKLRDTRPARPWREFANHDCRACHHPIGEPNIVWNARTPWDLEELSSLIPDATGQRQAARLQTLFHRSKRTSDSLPTPGFDEAVDLYLAAMAFGQDRNEPALTAAVTALGTAIERQHREHGGRTQYDLISKFNPNATDFQQAIATLEAELTQRSSP